MNPRAGSLARQYTGLLGKYLALQQETLLEQAYQLGREAMRRGLGVLDMVHIHQRAVAPHLSTPCSRNGNALVPKAVETFFMEALSPFEAAHRGFRDANLRLRQLNEVLEQRNAELRSLSSRILHTQEEERTRLSRELHDEVGQALTAVRLNLEVLQRNGTEGIRFASKKIANAQRLLAQATDTVHGFARRLRPAMLDELGLLPAIRSYLKEYAELAGLQVRFQGTLAAERLNEEQKTVLFRVVHESLTNVAKHAQISVVSTK